jgi:type II secretory pathway pseudopilin PulG
MAASTPPQTKGLAEQQTMRNGQNKRMRGRNRKGGHHQNPLSRMYESNGPDVKIRGTASHIAEKYLQLARDAQSSGDPVSAENYYQHAEHYFRLIAAAQEQFRQTQPYYQQQPGELRSGPSDDGYDDGGDNEQPIIGEPFAPREPQGFYPRDQQQPQPQQFQPRPQPTPSASDEDVERLPSFITGGGQSPPPPAQEGQSPNGPGGANGYDAQADRFPLHRRRRRHRGPRDHSLPGEGDGPAPSGPRPGDD